jgi:hypothetical protein
MELQEFSRALSHMDLADIRGVADAIDHSFSSADGEVAWWRAHLDIDHALKQRCSLRNAATAAHAVSDVVTASARRAGIALPDPDVTRVAREAQEIARAIVAGVAAQRALDVLLGNWRDVLRPVGV